MIQGEVLRKKHGQDSADKDALPFRVRSFFEAPCPDTFQAQIAADLTKNMPSFGVATYFEKKTALFDDTAITLAIQHETTGEVIAVIVGAYLPGVSRETLNIRTILIAEDWHRRSLVSFLWYTLFRLLMKEGRDVPQSIVFKTYNPKSFLAMAVFAELPGVEMFPRLDGANSEAAVTNAREVAEVLSPGCPFNERTGVLKGASDGVDHFYRKLPSSGRPEIDAFFKIALSQSDRMLCCLFVNSDDGAKRILQAFGI